MTTNKPINLRLKTKIPLSTNEVKIPTVNNLGATIIIYKILDTLSGLWTNNK